MEPDEETFLRSVIFQPTGFREGNIGPHESPSLSHDTRSVPVGLPKVGFGCGPIMTCILHDLAPEMRSLAGDHGTIADTTSTAADLARTLIAMLAHDEECLLEISRNTVMMTLELLRLNEPSIIGAWGGTVILDAGMADLLGMACGLEFAFNTKGVNSPQSVGLLAACAAAKVKEVQILTDVQHPAIFEAASILGLGRASVVYIGDFREPWKIDFDKMEKALKISSKVSIVSISSGKVTTGYPTMGAMGLHKIRTLCDQYGVWLHLNAGMLSLYNSSSQAHIQDIT